MSDDDAWWLHWIFFYLFFLGGGGEIKIWYLSSRVFAGSVLWSLGGLALVLVSRGQLLSPNGFLMNKTTRRRRSLYCASAKSSAQWRNGIPSWKQEMNNLIQPPSAPSNPVFRCGLRVVVANALVSPPYFCPGGDNFSPGKQPGCCCLAAVCRRDPFRGRHTCRLHGCSVTQQLSDHWWQGGEPGWHAGPLIVRPLICLYRRPCVCTPPGGQECCVNRWMDNKRLKCSYCHHQTQNMCLRSVLVPLVQPHAMRRQSVGFLFTRLCVRNFIP